MSAFKQNLKDFVVLVARVLISLIFIVAGFSKVVGYNVALAYMNTKGIMYPEFLLVASIFFELIGGIMVLAGWKARFGALLLFLFTIPVTFVFHSYWTYDMADMQNQMDHFLKNLAIMGGILYILALGPGRFSIDGKR